MPKLRDNELGTAANFYKAFEALQEEGIPDNTVALLQAHFNAPNHTATMAQLAEAVGFANYGGANMQYGILGRRLGEKLGIDKTTLGFWLHILAEWAGKGELGHQAFILRRPVIQALARLGILPKTERKKVPPDPVALASPTAKVIAAMLCNPEVQVNEVLLAAMEGRHYLAERGFRQRNRLLIEAKKKQSDGKCSVCGFDFKERYRGIEKDHLVAHHVKPIRQRKRASKTTLDQIDIFCPNCHAAAHSQDPPLTADQLRKMLIS